MNIPEDGVTHPRHSHKAPSALQKSCLKPSSLSTTQLTGGGSSYLAGPSIEGPEPSVSSFARKIVRFAPDIKKEDTERADVEEAIVESLDTASAEMGAAVLRTLVTVLPNIEAMTKGLEETYRGFPGSKDYVFLDKLFHELGWGKKSVERFPQDSHVEFSIHRAKSHWESLDNRWGIKGMGIKSNDVVKKSWPSIRSDLEQLYELVKDVILPDTTEDYDSEDSLFD